MARAEILTARCDRKECKTIVEIGRDIQAPEGWLQITTEVEGKYDPRSRLEFCSEKCVTIWARNRGASGVTHSNGNGHANARENVIAAIKALEEDSQWEFTVTDVANITSIHSTSVRKYFQEFIEGKMMEIRSGTGTRTDPVTYGRITGTELL